MRIMTEFGKKMKERRPKKPRIRKVRKAPSKERKPRNLPQITGFWGRGASLYRPGLFIKSILKSMGKPVPLISIMV